MRSFLVAAAALLTLALAPAGAVAAVSAAPQVERGIVQTVTPGQVELRALDGTVVSLAVGPATRVRLNGGPASLSQIQPGFVAEVTHRGNRPAIIVRAFGAVPLVVERGTVTALSKTSISMLTDAGAIVTIELDSSTRFVRRGGLPVGRFAARPGARVAVRHPDGGRARLVTVLKRAPA